MPPEIQEFDPDGDLTLILNEHQRNNRKRTNRSSSRRRKTPARDAFIHMKVSSKHMMLASPVFKAMFRHNFIEGNTLRQAGHVEVPLPDDHHLAFAVLMDIVYGRSRRVPRQVTLDFLATIAVLVDKYQLQEPVAAFSDNWIDGLKADIDGDSNSLVLWLCISWVFRKPDEFKQVTQSMILGCKEEGLEAVSANGEILPIPEPIINSIKDSRRNAISEMLGFLSDQLNSLLNDPVVQCTNPSHGGKYRQACDSMVLGSLLRSCVKQKLWPIPEDPYDDLTCNSVVTSLAALNVVNFCDEKTGNGYGGGYYGNRVSDHKLHQEIKLQAVAIMNDLDGLDLAEFE